MGRIQVSRDRIVKIGGAAAHWLDSATAVPQLLRNAPDYLILDYLSEGAMSVFARIMQQHPRGGFPPDFVTVHIGPNLREIMARKVKVVANAGGLNPEACAAALYAVATAAGLNPRVAIVKGDDLRGREQACRDAGVREMFLDHPFPRDVLSINAYLGAFPIAQALAAGADIVITGRVVDSALALGPLIHEFGWGEGDHDLLSAGTAVGHLLECGCHSTGGTFTDWREVCDGWDDMGFPIAECRADGTFVLTKPPGTGGLVSRGTVAEQLVYEVSDPQAYFVPDVVCDFSAIRLEEVGKDRVAVSGAKGYPPTGDYKVITAHHDGWRGMIVSPIIGFDAAEKAARQGEALMTRGRRMLRDRNFAQFSRTCIDVLGTEATYGSHARPIDAREVVLRIVVEHPEKDAAELFVREHHAAMTAMSVGTTVPVNFVVQPLSSTFSFLLPREKVAVSVVIDGAQTAVPMPGPGGYHPEETVRAAFAPEAKDADPTQTVPLISLAWGRSGDKGGSFNVAVIARRPEYLPYITAALTVDAVRTWFAHTFDHPDRRRVDRFSLPGIDAINFVVHEALGGGIMASNRIDPVAKTMAQQLLAFPIPVSRVLAAGLSND
jgi:hypothetical protein